MSHSLLLRLTAAIFLFTLGRAQTAQTVQNDWTEPQLPDWSSNFTDNDQVSLAWTSNLQNWFTHYCTKCNTSNVDLWLCTADKQGNIDEQVKVASAIDLTSSLGYNWTINVPQSYIPNYASQGWFVRFIPFDSTPQANTSQGVQSPVFGIEAASTSAVSSTSTTTSPTSSASNTNPSTGTTSTITPSPSPNPEPGLSTGAQAGIGVGVAVGALAVIALGSLWYRRSRRRERSRLDSAPKSPEKPPNYFNVEEHSPRSQSELLRSKPSDLGRYELHDNHDVRHEVDGSNPVELAAYPRS